MVAIHPHTQEHLTHEQVCEFVVGKAYMEKADIDQYVAWLNAQGGTDDQKVMDILFPCAAV